MMSAFLLLNLIIRNHLQAQLNYPCTHPEFAGHIKDYILAKLVVLKEGFDILDCEH